jgi:hypothetical protein
MHEFGCTDWNRSTNLIRRLALVSEKDATGRGSKADGLYLSTQTGNWGSCWLAESRCPSEEVRAGSKVAIKLVHRQGTPPSNARVKALWNEFKVLRSCGKPVHANLVQFKEFIITPSYALVVMDYYQQVCITHVT